MVHNSVLIHPQDRLPTPRINSEKGLAKILMRRCYFDKFNSEGNEFVKKLTDFYCKCADEHLLHILFCKEHPYGSPSVPGMQKECKCVTAFANNICDFCIQVKYLLNFKCYKLCLERIPVSIQDKLITAPQYFKAMNGCEPFFYFNEERNNIVVSLDNPSEPKILGRTVHLFLTPR